MKRKFQRINTSETQKQTKNIRRINTPFALYLRRALFELISISVWIDEIGVAFHKKGMEFDEGPPPFDVCLISANANLLASTNGFFCYPLD